MRIRYPELSDLQSSNVLIVNDPHNLNIKNFNNHKVIIYCETYDLIPIDELDELLKSHPDSFIIILTTRNYPIEYTNRVNCKIISMLSANSWHVKQMKQINIKFDDRHFNKYFLSLNNRAQWTRHALFQFIVNFKLTDKFYFTYRFNDRFNVGKNKLYTDMNKTVGDTWYNKFLNLDEMYNLLPINCENDTFDDKNPWDYGNIDLYNKSFCSVVTETYIDENFNVFLSEKTMKPLACGHPFMLMSSAGGLLKLQESGFETFSSIFDETYDMIESPQLRVEAVLKQILELSNKSIHDIHDMYTIIKPILEHNYNYFWNEWHNIYLTDITALKEEIIEIIKGHSI
jgi:hypothetical protein